VAIIATQTAKGAQNGGSWLDRSGYDAGKKNIDAWQRIAFYAQSNRFCG
jgi:hypothetical protein